MAVTEHVRSSKQKTEASRGVVRVGARGRLVLPAALRKQAGIEEGDRLVVSVVSDGTLQLLSTREVARRTRGIFAHLAPGVSMVDELIRERREEARREEDG